MGFMDMDRARAAMAKRGLDALLVLAPENFYYATGYYSFVHYVWKRAGISMAVIPRHGGLKPGMVVSENDLKPARRASGMEDIRTYPVWTEYVDLSELAVQAGTDVRELVQRSGKKPVDTKPDQYDLEGNFRLVADILFERGLSEGVIGIEMEFLAVDVHDVMRRVLPDAKFADSSALLWDLRLVKSAREIELLRHACRIAEAGIRAASEQIREGMREIAIAGQYRIGAWNAAVQEELRGFRDAHGRCRVGGEVSASRVGIESRVKEGDLIQLDVGADVSGYISDVSRVFSYKKTTSHQRTITDALLKAHQRMKAVLVPGRTIAEVFEAGLSAVRSEGFSSFSRGHLGHSVGLCVAEEPPYISPHCKKALEPGMLLSVECPYYFYGVGAFNLEDMVLITDGGNEVLNNLPLDLRALE